MSSTYPSVATFKSETIGAVFPALGTPTRLRYVIALLVLCGAISRAAPLFNHEGRLLRQFPSEDGYLMQTIARNIALGLGMSTAAGTIPTNGTQPLFTFVSAVAHVLADCDKTAGILYVLIISIAVSVAAAYALWRLARLVYASSADAAILAGVAAVVWFGAANTVRHSMNCLETGAYALFVILSVHVFVASSQTHARWSLCRCAGIGALLALAFWARNDAVLLIAAACLTRLVAGADGHTTPLARRFLEASVMGATTVVLALPWLINNQIRFGHLMPVSGRAESFNAEFGGNLGALPATLAEYITAVILIPSWLERNPVVIAASVLLVLGAIAALIRLWWRGDGAVRTLILLVGIYALGLCGFYGLYFGAAYFMSRYLFPLSPFLILLGTAGLVWVVRAVGRRWAAALATATAVVVLALAVGLNYRIYANGSKHMHFQVVEWVQRHVPEDVWVGAVQTGTLGYFHDRTINLDGKVNPHALAAQLKDGLADYVVSSPIAFLADWSGIATWHDTLPLIRDNFDVVVCDEHRNLGVLARQSAIRQTHFSGAR